MAEPRTANLLGALILALGDQLRAAVEAAAPEPGGAAAALALLHHQPGLTIERLRRALGLSHPGAVRLVDRLEARGLILRQASPQDGRAVALTLTAAGHQLCHGILAARAGALDTALAPLSPPEQAALGLLCARLLGHLTTDEDRSNAICRLCDEAKCVDCPVDAALPPG